VESNAPTEPLPPTQQSAAGQPSPDPAEREVRSDQIRSLRRWLIVAGVWALAATAIAVVAYLEARDAKDESSSRATQGDIDRVRNRLREDIDDLGQQVDGLPTQAEVNGVDTRVRKAQREATKATNDAADAGDDARRANTKANNLEERVSTLETESNDSSRNTR
jgi:uncharacterized protein YlxW (UPF0749 family)